MEKMSKTDIPKVFRVCKTTGLWTISRSIDSCRFASTFCKKNCYAVNNATRIFPNQKRHVMQLQERFWAGLTGIELAAILDRKYTQIRYLRLAGRGECVTSYADIEKIADLCAKNPEVMFWLPTRAWVSALLRPGLEKLRLEYTNLAIQASTDIQTLPDEFEYLLSHSWYISFFGAKVFPWAQHLNKVFYCPKSWQYVEGQKNECLNCMACFSQNFQIVHYRQSQIRHQSNDFQRFKE